MLIWLTWTALSQTTMDYTIQTSVITQLNPSRIELNWDADTNATGYSISRKLKTSNTWTVLTNSLPGSATQFTDTVNAGIAYEYRIIRNSNTITAFSYTYSGIEVPAQEYRGRLILIIDSTHASALAPEIEQLMADLSGDGWKVLRHDVSPADSVTFIKSLITADYNADIANTRCVFLLGHVPVPYSGNLNPDGHPDHQGAWPADVYYADMNGSWTDNIVNNIEIGRAHV